MANEHLVDHAIFLCKKARREHKAENFDIARATNRQAKMLTNQINPAIGSELQLCLVETKNYLSARPKKERKYTPPGVITHERVIITSHYTASKLDNYIGVQATASVNIRLPRASGLCHGQAYLIKDENGNANSYNITINTISGDTIDGQSSILLQYSHSAVNLYCDGENKFFIY